MKVCFAAIGLQDAELRQVEEALSRFSNVPVGRRFSYYPEQAEMQRFLRAVAPDVLFVSTALPMQMEAAVDQAIRILPNVQIVLVDSAAQPETLRRARRLGVQECLTIPFSTDDLHGVIERSLTRRANMPAGNAGTNCLYSFLPARGGVGSSFLAAQAALSLPVNAAHRGLLIDADLDGGMIQYLLKCPLPPWAANVENPQSLIEAMERVEQLDEHLWPRLVTGHGHLDVMQAGDSGGSYRPDPERLQDVLAFARRQYSVILVDLPAVINRLSAELILQSKAVFLVTTQEVASLHRARRRLRALEDLQPKDRVRLLVNRVDNKGGTPMDEVASIVGIPVDATFVNDYAAVQQAILAGSRLPVSRPLGRQLTDLAASLPADPVPVQPPRKLRFVEGGFALPH